MQCVIEYIVWFCYEVDRWLCCAPPSQKMVGWYRGARRIRTRQLAKFFPGILKFSTFSLNNSYFASFNTSQHTNMTTQRTDSAPSSLILCVSAVAVYTVAAKAGMCAVAISAILTTLCASPLFSSSHHDGTSHEETSPIVASATTSATASATSSATTPISEGETSHIFFEADIQTYREEEHSFFGRLFHQLLEVYVDDVDEILYVGFILRENQGLLLLLVGGIASMMMALVAGLDDVSVLRAFFLSLICYGVTTLLVARSARRVVERHNARSTESKLSHNEVRKIMQSIPTESFVPDEELEHCEATRLSKMIYNRPLSPKKSNNTLEDIDMPSLDLNQNNALDVSKQTLTKVLRQRRNYNETCCICISQFECQETILVLPDCHHEFHKTCIDQWAETFVAKRLCSAHDGKRGNPTCPLCNKSFGETPICLSAKK